jgi:hypothetical protein
MRVLAKIPTLDSLWLRSLPITSEGVATLSPLKNLKILSLAKTRIDDDALKHIGENFSMMERLDLSACEEITDGGMQYLAKLPNLSYLVLMHTSIGIDGLKTLKTAPIEDLFLEGDDKIDDACLKVIATQWPDLEMLNVGETKVTADGLRKYLGKFKNLRSLTLNAIDFNDSDIEAVSEMKYLESVHLMTTNITDKTLDNLKDLPHLKAIEAHQCPGLTKAGIQKLMAKKIKVDSVNEGKDTANALSEFLFEE